MIKIGDEVDVGNEYRIFSIEIEYNKSFIQVIARKLRNGTH